MHTVWVRLNAVVFFGLTVLLGLSLLAALSKLGHSYRSRPVIHKLQLHTLRSLKSHGGVDRALLSFDLDVDLRPAFHWNVKQLFVYVVASYDTVDPRTGTHRNNQVVLWDKIVESHSEDDDDDEDDNSNNSHSNKVINETNAFVKYALIDAGAGLRGKDVTLQLQWDFMPITGMLYIDRQPLEGASRFTLPSEYSG